MKQFLVTVDGHLVLTVAKNPTEALKMLKESFPDHKFIELDSEKTNYIIPVELAPDLGKHRGFQKMGDEKPN